MLNEKDIQKLIENNNNYLTMATIKDINIVTKIAKSGNNWDALEIKLNIKNEEVIVYSGTQMTLKKENFGLTKNGYVTLSDIFAFACIITILYPDGDFEYKIINDLINEQFPCDYNNTYGFVSWVNTLKKADVKIEIPTPEELGWKDIYNINSIDTNPKTIDTSDILDDDLPF